MRPTKLKKETLAAMLREMADGVESGDTLEGSIEFHALGLWYESEEEEQSEIADHDFTAKGVYRIGNLEGQGSARVVGEPESNPMAAFLDTKIHEVRERIEKWLVDCGVTPETVDLWRLVDDPQPGCIINYRLCMGADILVSTLTIKAENS